MKDIIPSILEKEREKIKAEIPNVHEIYINYTIFDGTARLGEAPIVIRYVQENFKPTQRLLCLVVLEKPL